MTSEKERERKRLYYLKNKEKIDKRTLEYYYKNKKKVAERISKKKKLGKFCKLCEVRLDGLYWGFQSKNYCSDCRKSGKAKKYSHYLSNKKWKKKKRNG
jgi:hypothetical protein